MVQLGHFRFCVAEECRWLLDLRMQQTSTLLGALHPGGRVTVMTCGSAG